MTARTTVADVPMIDADLPVFYDREFLAAYEASPLQQVKLLYVVIDGAAVVPCQFYDAPDALGTLTRLLPEGEPPSALLTHVLHCYDTRVPSGVSVPSVCAAMRQVAADAGAAWFGFVNVTRDGPLADALRVAGMSERPMPERYRLSLAGQSFDDHLATLPSVHRREFRRHVRRGAEAGVRVEVHDGATAHLEALVDLLADLAGRHDAAAYYPPAAMVAFVRRIPSFSVVTEVWLDDTLMAGAVQFHHRDTFHMWAAGARYGVTAFSPYYVLVHEAMRLAFASGAAVAEGGRGNGDFKQRHGFEPVPLSGFVARAREAA